MRPKNIEFLQGRFYVVVLILLLVLSALIARMVYLTVLDRSFLRHQADVRILRTVNIPAYRGIILSSDGVPLAISIPVDSVWMNPQDFPATNQNVDKLSDLLGVSRSRIWQVVQNNHHRLFVYLKREVSADNGDRIQALGIPGVYIEREYHRYYPEGVIASHVVGFTNVDDRGQEGLELAFNDWLAGSPGKKQVLKDRLGHVVADVGVTAEAHPGKNLSLSIHSRIQFLAYTVLKDTVRQYHAKSGSVVVMDPRNGEIIAMVNQPDFDPNLPHTKPYDRYRNRAVTDAYEPGSTMKAFSLANAIASGRYGPNTLVDTAPGWFMIGRNQVNDDGYNNGFITLTQILQKSSNVGVAKITLALGPDNLLNLLKLVGFGQITGSGFPGESAGQFPYRPVWRPFELATLAFGYGISVTPLQLVHAYTAIANRGKLCPASFLKQDEPVHCAQVMDPRVADVMLRMLMAVLSSGGTATGAVVPGYQVAGKTGTAHVAGQHGYEKDSYVSSFVGIAPVTHPRLVIGVMIRDPIGSVHFGGVMAAPAFSKIMSGALRILNVEPDNVEVASDSKVAKPFPENN